MTDDLHDRIVKQYLDYFKAHEEFERSPSVRNYANIRREIKALKNLVKERYDETRTIYYEAKKERTLRFPNQRKK